MNLPATENLVKVCDLEKGDKFIMLGRCYKVCYVGVIKITYREFFVDDITNIRTTTYSFGRKSQQLVELLKPK